MSQRIAQRISVKICDGLVIAMLLIWLAGGIPWQGRVLLKHGADPRRAALLLIALLIWLKPTQSWVASSALRFWRALCESSKLRWGILAFVTLWAAVLGALQSMALRYPQFDLGIFHQIIWSLAHGHGFHSTVSGAGNFLSDHFSPTLALYVPVFWLTGSWPAILPILHAFVVFGGVAAWVWFAERVPGVEASRRGSIAAATLIFGITFDSLWSNLRWGFHENATAFIALSWAFALLLSEKELRTSKFLGFLGLVLVAAFSKEILLVSCAAIFVGLIHPKRLRSLVPLILAMILIAIYFGFEKAFHPPEKNYFQRYYSYLGHGTGEMVRTLLLSPQRVMETIGLKELARYAMTLLLPFLFLPLCMLRRGPHLALWLGVLPAIASAALSTYPPLRAGWAHYVLEIWPSFAILTVLMLGRLSVQKKWLIPLWVLASALSLGQDPWNQTKEFARGAWESREVRKALALVPSEDSVISDEMTGAWLANRLWAARWPEFKSLPDPCPRWIVLSEYRQVEPNQLCPKGGTYLATRSVGNWSLIHWVP